MSPRCPHDTMVSKDGTLVCARCGVPLRALWIEEQEDAALERAKAEQLGQP